MPLIIETYSYPYTLITHLLFPGQEFLYIDHPISEPASELFCYTRDGDGVDKVRYCFNRIYFIENERIVSINKAAQRIKYYDLKTGKLLSMNKVDEPKTVEAIEKKEFLPQIHAQSGEVVIFPNVDEEEDEL